MKITFFSNYLNHHQIPFIDELLKIGNIDFTFVSTIETPKERLKAGYSDCSGYSYNLNAYENKFNFQKAIKLGLESDIVIIGSASDIFIKERLSQNKHTFRYTERILKQGIWRLFDPR